MFLMPKKVVIDLEELERFLDYMNDKVYEGFKKETTKAVREFIEDIRKRNMLTTNKKNLKQN